MASKENENTIKKETKNESKVKECPKCGSKDYIPILHGYPSPEAIEKAEKGELILEVVVLLEMKQRNIAKIVEKAIN